ncbi:tRNA-splicing ligase [Trifolium repens]|nr:tRNA-splicing ligase [Trifolium repens]
MGSKVIVIFIIMLVLAISVYGTNNDDSFSKQKILEVERKLQHLRKHSLKTIQSEDGDIIDCIDIKKQPAFDHPALKNHKIQMAPSYNSAMEDTQEVTKTRSKTKSAMTKQRDEGTYVKLASQQVWRKSGSCPKGTIPVRRIRKRQLLKAHSIDEYGRKKPSFSNRKDSDKLNQNVDSFVQQQNHSKAILLTYGYRYLGGKGEIIVCNPFVEKDDEYSTAQVSLLNGSYDDYELVESGWAVNPSVYGDRNTRLFVYWTADGSHGTGCFDLTCPGFIQTSNEIALGAAIYPISIPGGLPYQIIICIYKDVITNNWWVQYGEEKTNIGYWPPELFTGMSSMAESVEWGGEVYSTTVGHTPHTKTQMGNGEFASAFFDSKTQMKNGEFVQPFMDSASILRMRVHDNSAFWKIPEWVAKFSDEYNCYDVYYFEDYVEDPLFYYGGPGRNPMCL